MPALLKLRKALRLLDRALKWEIKGRIAGFLQACSSCGCMVVLAFVVAALFQLGPFPLFKEKLQPFEARKEARRQTIRRGFSGWDGSHNGVTKMLLKEKLRDPGSYEHIKTTFSDMGDHLIVVARFRSRNGFGGMMRQTIKVKADLDGNVVQILGFEQE